MAVGWSSHPAERRDSSGWWYGDLEILRAAGNEFRREVGNVNSLCAVVVRGWDNFDDLVAGKFEAGDVGCAAGHEIAVENPEDGLVGDDEEVVLLALELEDDRLEADCEVVVGLHDGLA
jgi:hypothetical protein